MSISEGLRLSLNKIRELSSDLYQREVPIITDTTSIGEFASPLLNHNNATILSEFYEGLVYKIIYNKFEMKYFKNPLQILEGDEMPLGYAGQETYVNPQKGRRYNPDDFAGILCKYEADVKVQYNTINMDVQYPVSVLRTDIKKAMTSWSDFESFVSQLTQSLYNGAYIDEYNFTKMIVSNAYRENKAVIEEVSPLTSKESIENFVEKLRTMFLNFQSPSVTYNAWAKVGGYGRPVTTWTDSNDIVLILRNDILSKVSVRDLAYAFNKEEAKFLGKVIGVDNFDIYNDDGLKIFDGSSVYGIICDKRWFKIKKQDMFMDTDYNPNNRVRQYYLNLIKMYNYSLFANGVILATEIPNVAITGLKFDKNKQMAPIGQPTRVKLSPTPLNGNTPKIEYTTSNENVFTVEADENDSNTAIITPVGSGSATLTATAGNVSTTMTIDVPFIKINGFDLDGTTSITVAVDDDEGLDILTNPLNANIPVITYMSTDEDTFTATVDPANMKHVTISGVAPGQANLIISAGDVATSIVVNVTE